MGLRKSAGLIRNKGMVYQPMIKYIFPQNHFIPL